MAHSFERDMTDPYAETARQLTSHLLSGRQGVEAGASEEVYDTLSNAIVNALGDIAAQAFRRGVNDPKQIRGLARAIASASETVLSAYRGEVDPEPALRGIESDPRIDGLVPEAQDKLRREIEKTRQLETLLLEARRLPDLIDYAGGLGLHIHEETLEQGTLLVPGGNIPGPGTHSTP